MAVPALDDQQRVASERLQAAGLPASELLAMAQIGARLVPDPAGATQLGGRPTMPLGWSWPEWNGRPLQYLARVDLKELSSVLSEADRHGLPAAAGQLHLLADPFGEGWGFDPADAGSFSAAIVAEDEQTVDYETPTGIEHEGYSMELELPVRVVRPVAELVLPDPSEDEMRALLDRAQFDAYWDLREELDAELFGDAPQHRLLERLASMRRLRNRMAAAVEPHSPSWRIRCSLRSPRWCASSWRTVVATCFRRSCGL